MIRVMLVDDHPVVRAGYARLLEQAGDMHVVAEADHAEQALQICDHGTAIDLVVSDLAMPGIGGMGLIRELTARFPSIRVLVFSMHDSAATVRRALESGAAGFVSKSRPPPVLVQALRNIAAGHAVQQVGPTPGPVSLAAGGAADPDRRLLERLTEREYALFKLLAQGVAPADCARLLGLSGKTVSNYQTLIRDKLGVATSAALVHLAIRCGVIT